MKLTRNLIALLIALVSLFACANAEPSLWVVKGPHTTIYLFGTVHVLKPGVPWRSPKIDAAIEQSSSLWLEIADVDDTEALQPLILKLGLDTAHPLSSRLTPDQLAKLDKAAKAAGLPMGGAGLEPMKPWLAAVTLSLVPAIQAGFDPKSGVELTLKPEFVKANKAVSGFETPEQQLHYFADMPDSSQVEYLTSELDELDSAAEKFSKIVAAWYAGDDETVEKMFSADFRDKYPDLYRKLVLDRNRAFATKIEELIKGEGSIFIAVGAGHLVGADGVPAILEHEGYRVVRK